MESIDITDSAFTLDIPTANDLIIADGIKDYTAFIYIGAAILIAFIVMFIYKFYINHKSSNESQLDCSGGFCNINSSKCL